MTFARTAALRGREPSLLRTGFVPERQCDMASLCRPVITRYVDADGKLTKKDAPGAKPARERSKTWRGKYADAAGVTRTVRLFRDKDASDAMLAHIVQRERELKAGIRRQIRTKCIGKRRCSAQSARELAVWIRRESRASVLRIT